MNCGLFGVRFSVFKHEKGAAAPIDYPSIFATAPFLQYFIKNLMLPEKLGLIAEINKIFEHVACIYNQW